MAGGGGYGVDVDFSEVEAALVRLQEAADRRMKAALQQVAEEVVVHAKTNHEYRDRTGRLTQSIRAEQVQGSFAEGFTINMISGGLRVSYAAHIEYGTRPHTIRPREGNRALRFTVGGQTRFARSVRHPGTRAYSFMRNALNAKVGRLEQMMELSLQLAAEEAGLV